MTAQGWAWQVVAMVLPLAVEVGLQQQQGLQVALRPAPVLHMHLQAVQHSHGISSFGYADVRRVFGCVRIS
jgi:hypothetical protein